jgi:hypothetical protein
MTISKANIIEKIKINFKDKESQYLIYNIIKKYSESSIIINKDDTMKIDMSKINNECLKELNKLIKNKESYIKYQENRDKEIESLKNKMKDIDLNKEQKIEKNYTEENESNEHMLNNWKKYWKSDYKGSIDNITEEHVRKIKNFKFRNKRFNEILKNISYTKTPNNKNETIIENGKYLTETVEMDIDNESEMNCDIQLSESEIDKKKLFGSDTESELEEE